MDVLDGARLGISTGLATALLLTAGSRATLLNYRLHNFAMVHTNLVCDTYSVHTEVLDLQQLQVSFEIKLPPMDIVHLLHLLLLHLLLLPRPQLDLLRLHQLQASPKQP